MLALCFLRYDSVHVHTAAPPTADCFGDARRKAAARGKRRAKTAALRLGGEGSHTTSLLNDLILWEMVEIAGIVTSGGVLDENRC